MGKKESHYVTTQRADEPAELLEQLLAGTDAASALDDLTFVLRHFLPRLNHDSIYRILKAEGLNRRPTKTTGQSFKGQGRFHDYDLGFIHIDVKHLPKLRTADGEMRKRFLYVAIDRCSRFVDLAVYDAENAANAVERKVKSPRCNSNGHRGLRQTALKLAPAMPMERPNGRIRLLIHRAAFNFAGGWPMAARA